MLVDGYEIQPLTSERFPDLEAILGRNGIGGCWCMYWACESNAAWSDGARGGSVAPNRQAFRDKVDGGPAPGLIAYDGDIPVAWCRVVPRSELPGLARSPHFRTDLETEGVWSLPCFVVKSTHRRRGLTAVLIEAAKQFARDHGGRILEGYPWDTDEKKSASTVYTGVASTFERVGFEEVQRLVPHKPMMRLNLVP